MRHILFRAIVDGSVIIERTNTRLPSSVEINPMRLSQSTSKIIASKELIMPPLRPFHVDKTRGTF